MVHPWKQENPALVRVNERYRASGDVVFLGILYQDSRESGLRYVKDDGVTWPTASDDDGLFEKITLVTAIEARRAKASTR